MITIGSNTKIKNSIIGSNKKREKELEKENKNLKEDFKRHIDRINELTNRIDKAIRILNSAKNHYDNDKTNWTIDRTLRVLKGSDNNV